MTKPASVSGAGLWWVDASGDTLSNPAEPVKPDKIARGVKGKDPARNDAHAQQTIQKLVRRLAASARLDAATGE